MTLADLVGTSGWAEVRATVLRIFPDAREHLEGYRRVFFELLRIAPRSNPMRIVIRTTFREGLDDEPFQEVVGRNGALNRDLEDFEHWGHARDSAVALTETDFGLSLRPWEEWLGMHIDADTLHQFAEPEIIAHCLWDMTFHGFTQAEISEERKELERRVAMLDAMTEEEKERYLIPAEQVFEELRSELEEPHD